MYIFSFMPKLGNHISNYMYPRYIIHQFIHHHCYVQILRNILYPTSLLQLHVFHFHRLQKLNRLLYVEIELTPSLCKSCIIGKFSTFEHRSYTGYISEFVSLFSTTMFISTKVHYWEVSLILIHATAIISLVPLNSRGKIPFHSMKPPS